MILLVSISVIGLFSVQHQRQLLGVLGLAYALAVAFICIRASRFTLDAIYQKNLNTHLIVEIENGNNHVTSANQKLEISSNKLNQLNINLEVEVKRRTDEILQLSSLDPLTQLINRKAFTVSLEALIEHSLVKKSPLVLMFIDLNGFKKLTILQAIKSMIVCWFK